MNYHKAKSILHPYRFYYLTGLIIILSMKLFYRSADCEALDWILAPTARWVRILTGISFEKDIRLGYVNHTLRFIIAPSCGGVQFMLVVFATLLYSFLHRMKTPMRKTGWLFLSLLLSYVSTIFINGVRIILAIYIPAVLNAVFTEDAVNRLLTPEQLHTAIGTITYFGFLLILYRKADEFSWRFSAQQDFADSCSLPAATAHSFLAPGSYLHTLRHYLPAAGCYFFIVLGIPLLNRLLQSNLQGFGGYALFITALCLTTLGLFGFI